MTNDVLDEILDKLKIQIEGRNLGDFSEDFLLEEINSAIGEINRCRRFTPTENNLCDVKYEYLVVPMCISSLAKIGAEGQNTHSENGIQRSYGSSGNYPKELTQQIIPLIK